jgi:hypothetical protein
LFPRRLARTDSHSSFTDSERHLILAAEAVRAGDLNPAVRPTGQDKPEERVSLFWRIFGGTILSICALFVINAYQSMNGNIHEVRGDLGRLREVAGDFIRKDDFNSRQSTLWNSIRELQAMQTSVTVLANKQTNLEQQASAVEKDHKELLAVSAALQALREKDAALEKIVKEAETERREFAREFQHLRERIAKLEGLAEKKASP